MSSDNTNAKEKATEKKPGIASKVVDSVVEDHANNELYKNPVISYGVFGTCMLVSGMLIGFAFGLGRD